MSTDPNPQQFAFAKWEAPTLRMTMTPATSVAGWTFVLNVCDKSETQVLQSSNYTVTDVALGIVLFPLTSAQAGALGVGDFDWDVWRVDAGFEKRLAWGQMPVRKEQWKA